MMRNFQVLEAASRQIDDIYNYTFDNFGSNQAIKYLNGLFATFEAIAKGEAQSRNIQAQYNVHGFYTQYEKHFIYWKILDNGNIGIAEILHQKMNLADQLAHSKYFTKYKDSDS